MVRTSTPGEVPVVDRTTGMPAYRQVAAGIREKIASGEYEPGARLPSERELVDAYGVSRPTIREAIGLLRSEGSVTVEHGRGVFVKPPRQVERLSRSRLRKSARDANRSAFFGDALAGGWTPSVSVRVRFEPADAEAARCLQIEEGDEVCVRDRVMRANGLPIQLATSRLPRRITLGTVIEDVDTGPGGTYARLEDAGFPLAARFPEVVSTRMPTPEEASMLQLAEGIPLLVVRRIALTEDGTPLEVNVMLLAGDKYELGYEVATD